MRFISLCRTILSGFLGALAFFFQLTVVLLPQEARADNGQCRYEGGPGAPTYQQCLAQDCIGEGGNAQCTQPKPKPDSPFFESETDPEKFHYWSCPPSGYSGEVYCLKAGGTWSTAGCSGLGEGYVRNSAQS